MRSTPLYQLIKTHQMGILDELIDSAAECRRTEAKSHGVGHVLVAVDPTGALGAYWATITTPAGVAHLSFDPDSPASRLLHSAGVTKIPAKHPVSAYVPLDIAVKLAQMAERPA